MVQYSLTIKHLLIECANFNYVRRRFYQVSSSQDLFKTVKAEVILDFWKAELHCTVFYEELVIA